MRVGIWITSVMTISMLQMSCGSVGPIMTMTGEMATVRLHDGRTQFVELLAVEDSSILCLAPGVAAPGGGSPPNGRVKEIAAGSISLIEVSGFRNDSWGAGVFFFQVLPAIGLTAAAASAEADAGVVFAVSMIPAGLTAILYAGSGVPVPTFKAPISNEDLLELRTYARFGGKLTSAQKEQLFRMHGEMPLK